MKTAVLISGQMRTFAKCYPTQKWQIFRHYEPDLHFFVSCVHDAQADSSTILQKDYGNRAHIEYYQDSTLLPNIPIEKGVHAPYANAASHEKLMLQHWGNYRVMTMFQNLADPESFDVIIRVRPDQWIHRFTPPPQPWCLECYCPWWGKFGGVNDRIAVMGKDSLVPYFGVMDKIQPLLKSGCPFHPETLVAASLRGQGITVRNTLMAECSTERLDGGRRWPETTISDLAELTDELSLRY